MRAILFFFEIILIGCFVYTKNQVIFIPLSLVGVIGTIFEIYEFKHTKKISARNFVQRILIVFFELYFLANYFIHFLPESFWD